MTTHNTDLFGQKLIDKKTLSDSFIVSPFSVLDTRTGDWKKRKRLWNIRINEKGQARKEEDFSIRRNTGIQKRNNAIPTEKQKKFIYNENNISILDAVLAEIIHKWFGIKNGKTFDCFAGDTIFGYVSSYLGNQFTGIELRQEQVDFNNERTKQFSSLYICDSGINVLRHIKESSQDLLFSCPPYFNLEVYSQLQNDASNQKNYNDFIEILNAAFTESIKCLKDNRFACIVIGNIRKVKSQMYIDYYPFKEDIIKIFTNNGMKYYNDIVLLKANGTAQMRAKQYMNQRKVVPIHEYLLVFYKGDFKNIKKIFYESENME